MKVIVLHEAMTELKDAQEYYDFERSGLGQSLVLEFNRAIHFISAFPNAWAQLRFGLKSYILDRFPYKIIYRVDEQAIIVLAFAHQHQKPNYFWRRT